MRIIRESFSHDGCRWIVASFIDIAVRSNVDKRRWRDGSFLFRIDDLTFPFLQNASSTTHEQCQEPAPYTQHPYIPFLPYLEPTCML